MKMPVPAVLAAHHGLSSCLLRLAGTGNPSLWEELSTRIGPQVLRLARRMTGDDALAADASQETLLRLFHRAGQFRLPEIGDADLAAQRWVNRLAINTVLMHMRRERRLRARAGRMETFNNEDSHDVQRQLERDEQESLVRRAIASLPPTQRAVVTLRYLAELTPTEIVEALQIAPTTMRKRLERGLRRLHENLRNVGVPTLALTMLAEQAEAAVPSRPRAVASWLGMKALVGTTALMSGIVALGLIAWPDRRTPTEPARRPNHTGVMSPHLAHGFLLWQEGRSQRAADFFRRALEAGSDADVDLFLEAVGADAFARMGADRLLAPLCAEFELRAEADWRRRVLPKPSDADPSRDSGASFSGVVLPPEPADEESANDDRSSVLHAGG
jgi:RNA polymerase sigma factor (sigma-70 family)